MPFLNERIWPTGPVIETRFILSFLLYSILLSLSLSLFLSSSREEIRRRFNLLDTIHIYEARQTINNLAPCLRASQSDDRSFVLLIDTFN